MRILPTCSLIICIFAMACQSRRSLFELVPTKHSNIDFNNQIIESDSINPFDAVNMYNGAGVGIADFNNDGLLDIYFAGNQVSSRLYQNRGNLEFRDVTSQAQVDGAGKWCRGVSVVDINSDGWQDIYVCATQYSSPERRKNLLYVNQGVNNNGVPVFHERSAEYGLDDDSHSGMAAFFDYDNDGDLDVYLTVNEIIEGDNPSVYRERKLDGSSPSTGRLYRNDPQSSLGHPFFTNVSLKAGITIEGYGHSASIADFNEDGWKDIFVANDFLSNDILYVNNQDGTFTDKAASYFKHTSANGMGADVIDINNDGLADVIEMDMDPEDNLRKKLLMSGYNYRNYQNNDLFGYQYQYVRNSLQLNQGVRPGNNDSIGDPVFSDVGFYAGLSSTDWSWAPVVQDFDNDGLRDIIITNGFPKDITDHDFIAFREKSFLHLNKKDMLETIPQRKIKNYAFRNDGNIKFSNVTDDWGFVEASFSNGAAYADLDNDGDLDMVISNINDHAFLYRNTTMETQHDTTQHLAVKLTGNSPNSQGIGAIVKLFYRGKFQVVENNPYRGYLSSMQPPLHFGLGTATKVDSIIVIWPNNMRQKITDVAPGRTLNLHQDQATLPYSYDQVFDSKNSLFSDITKAVGVEYLHEEKDFIDFDVQKLIPRKLSENTPAIASGDINNDGLDDLVVAGSFGASPTLLVQEASGRFNERNLLSSKEKIDWEAVSIALFDVEGDKDLDIYIACGSNEAAPGTAAYQDRLFLNNGKGDFTFEKAALPENHTSKSCVRAADFDGDGDQDLFIGGRSYPWNYPRPVSSMLLRNDSERGKVKFTDLTSSIAPMLNDIGMVCDAVWSDYNDDGWIDLVIAGEWMPLTFLKNEKGKFVDGTVMAGLTDKAGWWSSIAQGDFDNDGDQDYLAGNLGENSFYRASEEYPVAVYAKDFYKQDKVQCIMTLYLKEKPGGSLKEFTAHNRDDVVEQLPFIKKRFLTYADFGKASFDKLFTESELQGSIRYTANHFSSSLVRNNGNGQFRIEPLPSVAQFSVISSMVTDDFNNDGNLDVFMNTNDFAGDPSNGRYDALNGLVLMGQGDGTFKPLSILQSGIFVPGSGKGLAKLRGAGGTYMLASTQNKGKLKLFQLRQSSSENTLLSSFK